MLLCGVGMMGKNTAFILTANPDYHAGVYGLYPTDVAEGIRTNARQFMSQREVDEQRDRIPFTTALDSKVAERASLPSNLFPAQNRVWRTEQIGMFLFPYSQSCSAIKLNIVFRLGGISHEV